MEPVGRPVSAVLEVDHCWRPSACMGLAYHAPHTWRAAAIYQCPGHVRIRGSLVRLDRLPTEDIPTSRNTTIDLRDGE